MRSSQDSPLRIAVVPLPTGRRGALAITICPRKNDAGRGWDRDLATDVAAIKQWGATIVVTLLEAHEFQLLQVQRLGDVIQEQGMRWVWLPVRDVSIPGASFETGWAQEGLANKLRDG